MGRKKKLVDPYAEREAEKYPNPIPSREFIMDFLSESGQPARRDDLIAAFNLTGDEAQEALRRRLRAMERDGQLVLTRRGGYGLAEKMDLVRGRVQGHRDGFGFIIPEDGSDDLFISARQMRTVLHGDRVLARVSGVDRKGRREGSIVEILERVTTSVVGRFFEDSGVTFVIPDNKRITQDILIPPAERGEAKSGQIVVAEIISPPNLRSQAIGHVREVLGEHMAPGMEIEIAIRSHNLPYEWSDAVKDELSSFREVVNEKDKQGLVDLREFPFVTIDGEDAKDFDDAVFAERKKKGWILYVAIADVSHYVAPDSALDQEALLRGTSVYFPGEVIPMLPEILSNGLCSLKPEVDRLCLVCEMDVNSAGKLKSYEFYRAVIHSNARLTYTEVAKMLANPKAARAKRDQDLFPHLQILHELYEVLHETRQARGAIDFETVETKVIFGPQRKIKQIVPAERNVAHRMIEEAMLLANVSAARFVLKQKMPALFRIHEGPNPDKLQDLREFLGELGLRLPGRKIPKPQDYAQLLQSIQGRADAHLIQTILLRSMSQAVYNPDNIGHFGLAYDEYAHFTSPIRRYPDLLLHRAICHILAKGKRKNFAYDHAKMVSFGEHCSMTERRADDATRDAMDWLKCEYIKDRVGEEFEGIITNVTGFGLFVELKDIYVEGLVHVTSLKNDYYHFDPKSRKLKGERSGKVYHLGDRLKVRVTRVDLESKKIDFDIVEARVPATKQDNKKQDKKPDNKKRRTQSFGKKRARR